MFHLKPYFLHPHRVWKHWHVWIQFSLIFCVWVCRVDVENGPRRKERGGDGWRTAKLRVWSWSTLLLVHSYAHSSLQTTKLCSEQVALCYICWLNHKHSLFLCFTRNFLWPGVYRLQERCWACPVSNCSVLVIEWAGYNLQSQSKHPIPQTGQAASGSVFQETLQLWLSDL